MSWSTLPLTAAIALLAAMPSLASAQPDNVQRVRDWAASCSACHGPAGRAPANSPVPGLAGRPQADLVAQMQAFKAGTRPATVMHQIAKGYTDEQIAAIAAWFAAVK
ncbi:c-type cytochrome [Cupriavidus sp. AU9028]|uniref:c-type cytochrome n=1 Tax=Cupriavidus sp. AU9028 TaxID=2871157 RepID=UPI001C93C8A1|nr:c-type cytochrome [Cupriavidus sp. AU9028]MBY4899023.1 c-type cytochrome [Cupriavidus sp. AU9028]